MRECISALRLFIQYSVTYCVLGFFKLLSFILFYLSLFTIVYLLVFGFWQTLFSIKIDKFHKFQVGKNYIYIHVYIYVCVYVCAFFFCVLAGVVCTAPHFSRFT